MTIMIGHHACAGGDDDVPKKKAEPVNAEINGREVDFKNISIEEALQILEVIPSCCHIVLSCCTIQGLTTTADHDLHARCCK